LSEQSHIANDILQLLQQRAYRRIFCPWRYDSHSDHTATFLLTQLALQRYGGEVQIWLYEIWKPLESNMLVPIDNTVGSKREAMLQYRSQLPQLNYHDGFLGLSAYRSLFCPPSRFAEAFYVCDKSEMLRL
jgi:LmbE family N-acetylglucosaminyl deacetylase